MVRPIHAGAVKFWCGFYHDFVIHKLYLFLLYCSILIVL